jgi:hypothetical protein
MSFTTAKGLSIRTDFYVIRSCARDVGLPSLLSFSPTQYKSPTCLVLKTAEIYYLEVVSSVRRSSPSCYIKPPPIWRLRLLRSMVTVTTRSMMRVKIWRRRMLLFSSHISNYCCQKRGAELCLFQDAANMWYSLLLFKGGGGGAYIPCLSLSHRKNSGGTRYKSLTSTSSAWHEHAYCVYKIVLVAWWATLGRAKSYFKKPFSFLVRMDMCVHTSVGRLGTAYAINHATVDSP